MRKIYPILTFEVEEDKNVYNLLKQVIKMSKSEEEIKRNFYIYYMTHYKERIRKTMCNSDNEDLKKLVNNYISIYLKNDNKDNLVRVIVYDKIKEHEDAYTEVYFEKTKDGKVCPFIMVKEGE